ncbi:ATP-binding protein [Cellulomonas bogoriensis]|uniref:ATPase n=1 Tax=Cellulomonas bogoriensis 69B4 = DSM 16987 TaxID=1386082 RepID=A0A0A0C4X9_9CELL|nr:ATP-binding protein [Cellulomonas bogoriensis]KGM14424.1 ATPase [Cellulomonas bogoriensis 69B4 = DSM 16987]
MARFVGRSAQLHRLEQMLTSLTDGRRDRPGRALLMRGRRRVGKSRLVEEFLERSGVPHVFFTASMQPPEGELGLFAAEVASSNLPGARTFSGVTVSSWDAALRLLATALPPDRPSVVVIDELPYLTGKDPRFEGTLQKAFDRELSRLPVLLIGIGSDLAMMEALNEYGRPFHQRATEMVVPPLTPWEVGAMLGLEPAQAIDAYLVTGGLPLVCAEWPEASDLGSYVAAAVSDPTSALLVSGERAIAAEFPPDALARRVLGAVGAGERTFTAIQRAAGDIQQASLNRALQILLTKRVVVAERPLSTRASRETRYRVADPYLRFWLAYLAPGLAEIERGRGDVVHSRIRSGWTSWRGRAVEPVVREALERLPLPGVAPGGMVGGYWTRSNDPEVDVVIADRSPVADQVRAVGSIKWLERQRFDRRDLSRLLTHRSQVPGADEDTPLVVVSRSGCDVPDVPCIGPDELIRAWAPPE